MQDTNNRNEVIIFSDVSDRDGIGIEIWEDNEMIIEIFRDDSEQTREVTVFGEKVTLAKIEKAIEVFKQEIPWDFSYDRSKMIETKHPLDNLLAWLPNSDFEILARGFAPHGRDYAITIQNHLESPTNKYELMFTHCVFAECKTQIKDASWKSSWADEFIDYTQWEKAGNPNGYVWGVNHAVAYPGITAVKDSNLAHEWGLRLDRSMYEVLFETNQYDLRLVFHSIKSIKIK